MSLSPCVTIDRSQKLTNPFVSETTESACICICICITVVIDIIMSIQHMSNLGACTKSQTEPPYLIHWGRLCQFCEPWLCTSVKL